MSTFAPAMAWIATASTALAASPATAQTFRVPADLTSGVTFTGHDPLPFTGGFHLAGTFDFGQHASRVGPAAEVLYTGGGWHAAAGARLGHRLIGMVDGGLFGYVEGLVGDHSVPLSAGLVGEVPVGSSLRTGLWYTYDARTRLSSLALLLGTDLSFWFRAGHLPPPRRPGDTP